MPIAFGFRNFLNMLGIDVAAAGHDLAAKLS